MVLSPSEQHWRRCAGFDCFLVTITITVIVTISVWLMMFQMLTEDNLDPMDLLTYLGPDGPTAADPSANDADLLSLFS